MGKVSQVIKTAADIHERGIALKVLTQNIDTSTSEGRLFFHMTAAFDELGELKQTSPKFHRILRKPIAGKA